jgi:putative membrane protein
MAPDPAPLGALVAGTLLLRPYVFAFLVLFLVAAARDLGTRRMLGFLAWGFAVAFAAEYLSTRAGVPFGLYHYTGTTAGAELYLSNVPFFTSPSFVFLAYAALCLARWTLGEERGLAVVLLSGVLMMLLDVVIDPLAVRGDRWFLGRIFYYPAGGAYFGVPLSNFAGWVMVGWGIVGGYVWATSAPREGDGRGAPLGRSLGAGMALYYAVLLFNLVITAWIGEWGLLAAGFIVHAAGFLVLYPLNMASMSRRLRAGPADQRVSPEASSVSGWTD